MASQVATDSEDNLEENPEKAPISEHATKKSLSNTPMSFYEALIDRYLNADQFQVPDFVHFDAPPPTNFESDGYKLGKLKTLGLDNKNIYRAGIPAEGLASLCPNVTLLHLAKNNLQNWSEIETILREFPHLEECNLHRTSFTMEPEEISDLSPQVICSKLHTLNLSYTHVGWPEIQHITLQCPNLRDLDLCGNGISSISVEALKSISNIVVLTLSLNSIESWGEVLKLGVLTKLETLHLNDNPISFDGYSPQSNAELIELETPSIDSGASDELAQQKNSTSNTSDELVSKPNQQAPLFASLLTLSLAAVNICRWHELDIIADLPALRSVRLRDIPLAGDLSQLDRRKIFLSWFPNIAKLNGSTYNGEERVSAERFTIRYFSTLEYKPLFLPRLIKKHGDLKQLKDIDISFGYKEMVKVEFIYESKIWRRQKISVKQTVKELIFWLKKELKVPRNSFLVYYQPVSASHNIDDLRELSMSSLPLSRFNIRDGDQILIVNKV